MSWLYSDPEDEAQNYLDQIPGEMSSYLQPYVNAGQQALGSLGDQIANLLGNYGNLQTQYGNMISNPTGEMNAIGSTYQESPGYQWQVEQGNEAINNAAAAGGYLGTPQQQEYSAKLTQGLASQNYGNYVKAGMQNYNQGIKGEQGFYNQGLNQLSDINHMGYNASSSLAEGIAQMLMQQANLSYASQANRNQHRGGIVGGAADLAYDIFH